MADPIPNFMKRGPGRPPSKPNPGSISETTAEPEVKPMDIVPTAAPEEKKAAGQYEVELIRGYVPKDAVAGETGTFPKKMPGETITVESDEAMHLVSAGIAKLVEMFGNGR